MWTSNRPTAAETPSVVTEPVLLIIADISGYSRFMTASAKSLAHSQTIVSRLIKTLIKDAELPLTVAKLEVDIVLFYAKKEDGIRLWSETKHLLGGKLIDFFNVFSATVEELGRSTICQCEACRNINQLKLKVVAHSGEALFYDERGFHELSGEDVLLTRHLLKNCADEILRKNQRAVATVMRWRKLSNQTAKKMVTLVTMG